MLLQPASVPFNCIVAGVTTTNLRLCWSGVNADYLWWSFTVFELVLIPSSVICFSLLGLLLSWDVHKLNAFNTNRSWTSECGEVSLKTFTLKEERIQINSYLQHMVNTQGCKLWPTVYDIMLKCDWITAWCFIENLKYLVWLFHTFSRERSDYLFIAIWHLWNVALDLVLVGKNIQLRDCIRHCYLRMSEDICAVSFALL